MIISTPGRICFFGEHQDYLGLPVIAAAISRRIQIDGDHRTDKEIVLHLPDINLQETFSVNKTLPYLRERDYYRSTINVLKKRGLTFINGVEGTIHGDIPINSGTSSSSALIVTWAHFLDKMSESPRNFSPKELGEIANEAEVLEFGEPGGMMDHYSTAMGNIIYLESTPSIYVESLSPNLGTFVLGDSLEPKDTLGILAHTRYGMEAIMKKIKALDPSFSIFTYSKAQAEEHRKALAPDEFNLFMANIDDRDILKKGRALLSVEASGEASEDVEREFGKLLYAHHENLRDFKWTSTPKIDRMIEAALNAGALGGKINGSGGGGCMFAYAPDNAQEVAEAIERQGGKSYIIEVDEGTKIDG